MAAKSKTRVAVSYDSHSDTSDSEEECDIKEEIVSDPPSPEAAPPGEASDNPASSDADVSDLEDDEQVGESGMANVMAKILGKKIKTEKVILAKAKTDRQIQYQKREKLLEEEEEIPKKKKKEDEEFIKERRNYARERADLEKKKRWEEMGRVRPNALEKNAERKLKRIATQGVVQLFNAVKSQQKVIEEKIKEVGTSEVKREKVLKSFKKGDFLDMLKSTTPNIVHTPEIKVKKEEVESDDEDGAESKQPGWKILRDDFMMGGSMKDWDKQSDDDDNDDDSGGDDVDEDSSGDDVS